MSFHSSSYLFSDCPIELGIGLIELRIGLIELRVGLIELGIGLRIHILLGIGLIELGKGLMELGIGLRIITPGAPSWPVYPALLNKGMNQNEKDNFFFL